MKRKSGFTLVELLVVIVILGIITGISIPLIRNIQAKNEMRKYTTYMDGLKTSAKLYVDSYGEDLFGHSKSGCAIIKYSQMEEKGLLKDIALGDVSCKSENTFVKVVRVDDKTGYSTSIECGKKKNDGSLDVETQLPEGGLSGVDICGVDQTSIISFSTTPASSNSINYQKRNITIHMLSNTGVYEDYNILYGFVKKENKPEDDSTEPTVVDGWKKLNINYIGGNEQKKKIENGEAITLSSDKITTPNNQTGDYYIVLKIETLKDLSGRNWSNEGKHVYLGTFRIDNTKPVFSDDSTVVSSNNSYNHIKPKLKINVTDNYSNSSNLRMCISYDNDTCLKTAKDIKDKNGYINYDKDKVLDKIKDNYDGSEHTIYVTVGDAAGNYTTKNYTYKLASKYRITYDSNGGNACNPTSKEVTSSGNTAWGTLCAPTRKDNNKDNPFVGWYLNKEGTGNPVTKDTLATKNITVYAKWRDHFADIWYNINGGNLRYHGSSFSVDDQGYILRDGKRRVHHVLYNGTIDPDNGLLDYDNRAGIYIRKPGFYIKRSETWKGEVNGVDKTFNDETIYHSYDFCDASKADCQIILYANWKGGYSYTLRYDSTGGSECERKTVSGTTDNLKWGSLCTPTRRNYTFVEWNTKKDGTGTKVTANTDAKDDLEVYAQWKKNRVMFTYHIYKNEGENLTTQTTDTDGVVNTWSTNTGGQLMKANASSNGAHVLHKIIDFDETKIDIPDYNNPKYIEIKKNGYKGKSGAEWICDKDCKTAGKTFSQASNTPITPSEVCDYSNGDCKVMIRVNWEPVNYTISYNLGSGSANNPTSYNITTNTITLEAPTHAGMIFTGWTGSNGSTPQMTVTIPKGSTGNKSYTAHWMTPTSNFFGIPLVSYYVANQALDWSGGLGSCVNGIQNCSATTCALSGVWSFESPGNYNTVTIKVNYSSSSNRNAKWLAYKISTNPSFNNSGVNESTDKFLIVEEFRKNGLIANCNDCNASTDNYSVHCDSCSKYGCSNCVSTVKFRQSISQGTYYVHLMGPTSGNLNYVQGITVDISLTNE